MDVIRKVETTDVDIIYDYEKLFFKDYWSKDQILIEITNINAFNLVFLERQVYRSEVVCRQGFLHGIFFWFPHMGIPAGGPTPKN